MSQQCKRCQKLKPDKQFSRYDTCKDCYNNAKLEGEYRSMSAMSEEYKIQILKDTYIQYLQKQQKQQKQQKKQHKTYSND